MDDVLIAGAGPAGAIAALILARAGVRVRLIERAKFAGISEPQRAHYLDQLGETAQSMVTTLDEIVWTMNPRHDSLASLVGYLGSFAERFLAPANLTLQLDVPSKLPDVAVASGLRHQLFLVFKEALANVIHHAAATRVNIRVTLESGRLCCIIADNGQGLAPGAGGDGRSGLSNMKERIEKLGGRIQGIESGWAWSHSISRTARLSCTSPAALAAAAMRATSRCSTPFSALISTLFQPRRRPCSTACLICSSCRAGSSESGSPTFPSPR